jgi:hypothetical protein
MPDSLQNAFYKKRSGVTIAESLILMLVLGLTFGAIFATMGWAQRSYIHNRLDRESRELFFNWVQAFDARWRPEHDHTNAVLTNRADSLREEVALSLNGTFANGVAHIGAFTLEATPRLIDESNRRVIEINIVIRSGNRRDPWVNLVRVFSAQSNDGVSDWGSTI